MKTAPLVGLLSVVLASAPEAPQTLGAAPKVGSVEGVVLGNDSGPPLARALVRFERVLNERDSVEWTNRTGETEAIVASALTDATGRFRLAGVETGAYRVTAQRNGYVRARCGQSTDPNSEEPINVASGQSVASVTCRLVQAGTISGHVHDAFGDPAAGLEVHLFRAREAETGPAPEVNRTNTDDRGEYRFYWIEPGRYYVRVTRPDDVSSTNVVIDPRTPSVYYPGVESADRALAIDLKPGREIAIDFVMPRIGF